MQKTLKLLTTVPVSGQVTLEIVSLEGKMVACRDMMITRGGVIAGIFRLPAAGFYLIRLRYGDNLVVRSIVVW
jgi:hypothetical protein